MREYEMWGIWNACQGVFGDTISYSREQVEAVLSKHSYGNGRVVPVLVRVESDKTANFYRWLQADKSTERAVEARGGALNSLDAFND